MGRWKRKSTSKKHHHHLHRHDDNHDNDGNNNETNVINNNNLKKENESNNNNNVKTTTCLENELQQQHQQEQDDNNNNKLFDDNNNKEEKEKYQQKNELVTSDSSTTTTAAAATTTINSNNNNKNKNMIANNIPSSSSPMRIKRFSYFNSYEKVQIRSYLVDYRNIATNVSTINKDTVSNNNDGDNDTNNDSIIIGGHEFLNIYNNNKSATTTSTQTLSYLKLPKTLTSKHRHYLHDLCLELNLYHDSYYDENNKRCMAISITINDLAQVLIPNNKDSTSIPLHICKPWFYLFHNHISTNITKINTNNGVTTPIKDNRTLPQPQSSQQDNNTILPRIPCNYVKQCTTHFESIIQRYIDNPLSCIINNDNHIIQEDIVSSIQGYWNKDDTTANNNDNCDNNDDNVSSTILPYEADTWMYVDTVEKLKQCINEIKELNPKEIGFDLELHNKNKYTCITCLLQLSTIEKTYVIDPYATTTNDDNNIYDNISSSLQEAQQQQQQQDRSSPTAITPTPTTDEDDEKEQEETVWNTIPKLSQFFSNPNIIKIGHCINSMDVPGLHRDFGIFCVNVFDTHEAARILKINKQGLAALCNYYKLTPSDNTEYSKLKELYQRQDWRCRPLHDDMLRYARYDVYYLIQLRKFMIHDILLMDEPERIMLTTMNNEHNNNNIGIANNTSSSSLERKLISRTLSKNMSEKRSSSRSMASSNVSDDEGYFTPAEDEVEVYDSNNNNDPKILNSNDFAITNNNSDNNDDITNDINVTKIIQKYYKTYLQVLKLSQKSCISFWKHKIETYTQNEHKRDIQKREGPRWTTSHEYLYNHLVSWRNHMAYNMYNTMPGLILPTELLVYIAYKRPSTYEELRYISFILPQILEDNDYNCRDEIFSLVQSSFDREYHHHHGSKSIVTTTGSTSTRSSPSKKIDSISSLNNASSSPLSNDNNNNNHNNNNHHSASSASSLSTKDTTTEKNKHNDDDNNNIISREEKDETNGKTDKINIDINNSTLILKCSIIALAFGLAGIVICRSYSSNRGRK